MSISSRQLPLSRDLPSLGLYPRELRLYTPPELVLAHSSVCELAELAGGETYVLRESNTFLVRACARVGVRSTLIFASTDDK